VKFQTTIQRESYTLAEDGTSQSFKITTSTVDLKAHVGHNVELTVQKANAPTTGSPDNSVAVTGVSMISEHCATAAATTTPVPDATPAATASTPVVADATPTATATTPVVADATQTATVSTPPVADTTPTATVSAPPVADSKPAATASAPLMASARAPEKAERLPDTASSLPLLGLLGLGLLTTGQLYRRSEEASQER